jgi:ribonuclease HI
LALNNRESKQETVKDTKLTLNRLREQTKYVTIAWTRAHIGNKGNERADKLAKEGTKKGNLVNLGRPVHDIKARLSRRLK